MAAPSPGPASPRQSRRRPRWPRSRRGRQVLILLIALFTAFCAVTARLFVFPDTGMPSQVSAIVVPGGPGSRIDAALQLARHNHARYLVISEGQYIPPRLCGSRVGLATVICFAPDPRTTQGEAEATAHLARQYDFTSIALVTTPDQTWRAELRFRRCYSGDIYAVTTPLPLSLWPVHIAYQWAATVKAELINRAC